MKKLPIKFTPKQKTVKVAAGVTIMLTGAAMATHPVTFLPHFLWDALAYGLHGYGALPVLKILCSHFDLEHIESRGVADIDAEIEKLEKLKQEIEALQKLKGA